MSQAACATLLTLLLCTSGVAADSIDKSWEEAEAPPRPRIETVVVEPATTALLVLDIEERTCNRQDRPRCLKTVPQIAAILKRARAANLPVVYSLTPKGTPETILREVEPVPGEPIVASSVDKFWNTDLEQILRKGGVKTVIVTGTAAHGAVLHTASAAAYRGFQVVLPVDGLSAEDLYTEQAAVHLLVTGPATRGKIALTRTDMIEMR